MGDGNPRHPKASLSGRRRRRPGRLRHPGRLRRRGRLQSCLVWVRLVWFEEDRKQTIDMQKHAFLTICGAGQLVVDWILFLDFQQILLEISRRTAQGNGTPRRMILHFFVEFAHPQWMTLHLKAARPWYVNPDMSRAWYGA